MKEQCWVRIEHGPVTVLVLTEEPFTPAQLEAMGPLSEAAELASQAFVAAGVGRG